ncbi:IS3 family transposase [Pseudomonas sp. HTZ2]|uniref:IS3 family transposase n=1 Tax=Pseudomonas sp. HTZ2 TaxID=3075220 RepID=UPI002958754B|nr:IS3 family transposase [Pseudomonas sp. HTZ2]
MSRQRYPEEFKIEAVKQVTEKDYIEMFYNPKRRHSSAMQLSPVEYEKRYFLSLESV